MKKLAKKVWDGIRLKNLNVEEKVSRINITRTRRIVQVVAFFLFVFGGLIITRTHLDSGIMPFVKPPAQTVKMEHLEPKTSYEEVFDTYFPTRTCRYIEEEPRLFRACAMHFLTEVPVYGVPLYDFLPHLLVFVALGFLLSRFMCGWLCPMGAMQDFLGWLRKILGLKYLKLPKVFLDFFEKFRYVWLTFLFIMGVAIVIPVLGLIPYQKELNVITCNTCPGRHIFPLFSLGTSGWWSFDGWINIVLSLLGVMFLGIFLMSFFGKRLWCRICPTGALISLFNKGGAIVKVKNAEKCTKCGVCERVCPLDNKKVFEEKKKTVVNSFNCINCFRCVDRCPEDNCIQVKFLGLRLFSSRYKNAKGIRGKDQRV